MSVKLETKGASGAPLDLVTEVPVVNPNTTAANAVGLVTALTPVVLWTATYFEVPLTVDNIAVITSAMGVMAGLFIWIKNRFFTAEATIPSANLKGLHIRVKMGG